MLKIYVWSNHFRNLEKLILSYPSKNVLFLKYISKINSDVHSINNSVEAPGNSSKLKTKY